MANTLTNVLPLIYGAGREASREMTGLVRLANVNFGSEGAALNDTIKVPRVAAATNSDYTPAMTTTVGGDMTPTTDDLQITKSRHNTWHFKHEERASLLKAGTFGEVMRLRTVEGIRALINELEQDLWLAGYKASSRGHGTAGTTPFASSLSDLAQVKKILDDNGCPSGMRGLAVDTTAGANLMSLTQLTNVNQAGSDALLRDGVFGRLGGFQVEQSGQISLHTKGTGSGYLINDASPDAGDITVTVDTGTGTILAGDIVTFAGTSTKYVVNSALASNAFGIGRPGLRTAESDNDAITVGNNYTPNLALHKNALAAVVRPPVIEPNANMRLANIGDEQTGLSVVLAEIIGDGMTTYRVHLSWGVKVISPEHIATLLG